MIPILQARRSRTVIVPALFVLLLALVAPTLGGHLAEAVKSYTGCLTNGTIVQVAEGNAPAKRCNPGSAEVHFSGGDITAITGINGLEGGAAIGAATLGIAAPFRLPQTCSVGQMTKWDGIGWACAADDDATYTAGTGLELEGSAFGIERSYRLPQDCELGDAAVWGQTPISLGEWTCQPNESDTESTPPLAYRSTPPGDVRIPDDDTQYEIVRLRLPAGKFVVTVTGSVWGADLGDESRGTCFLQGGGLFRPDGYSSNPTTGGGDISMTSVVTLANAASVYVTCNAISSADHADAEYFELVAVEVS